MASTHVERDGYTPVGQLKEETDTERGFVRPDVDERC